MLATSPKKARRHADRSALVAQRLDRRAGRYSTVEWEIDRLDILADGRTR
jgi:hypothetical protein